MIAGLEQATAGQVLIAGKVVNDLRCKDRDVSMVFQDYALYPHLSVYQNIAFGLKLRGLPKGEIGRKVRWAAEMLGIEGLLERKPNALSGGQRQRVAVGRAIVRTCRAYLFDEPLSNLDARLRVQMRTELKDLHRRLAATFIYVTHDQEEAMILGDRVAVMADGVIQQCGSALSVYNQPVNRFVAGFIGKPSMNFIEGRLFIDNGYMYFVDGSDKIRFSQRLRKLLAGWNNQRVVLGIRPEVLSVSDEGEFSVNQNVLNVTVKATEPLGDKTYLHVETVNSNKLVCCVAADQSLEDGTRLVVHLDMDRVHIFEPGDEGVNIILQETGGQTSAA
jgi:multiple sugar transport system ATP-binding protein